MTIWKTTVGLELAEKDLRIAVVRALFGRLRLEKCVRVEGFAEMAEDLKREAVSKAIKGHRISNGHVWLTLPRDSGVIRQVEFPVQVVPNLKSTLAFQVENLAPWPMDELYWDFAVQPDKTRSGTCRVTIAIVPRNVLDGWIAFFKSAGLPLSGARLSPLSAAHGVAVLWKPVSPTVVVHSETGYVEGTLVREEGVTSLVMDQPSSGASRQLLPEGEGTSLGLLLARLGSLAQMPEIENVRLIAYGTHAGSLQPAPVALPIANIGQAPSDGFGAIASSLAGLGKSGFKVNLIPAPLRYRRNQLQLIPTYLFSLIAALLVIAMVIRNDYQYRQYAARLEAEISRLEPEVKQVLAQQTEMKAIEGRYGALKSYQASRDLNLEALREFARLLPPDSWLMNYASQDQAITVSGVARTALEMQKVLEDSPLFKEVQFVGSVTRDPGGKEHFVLRMKTEAAP